MADDRRIYRLHMGLTRREWDALMRYNKTRGRFAEPHDQARDLLLEALRREGFPHDDVPHEKGQNGK